MECVDVSDRDKVAGGEGSGEGEMADTSNGSRCMGRRVMQPVTGWRLGTLSWYGASFSAQMAYQDH